MSWTQVDEGWGRKAVDYAYLIEVQMWPEYVALLDACGVGDGTRVLDVACGPAYALRIARDRGAVVSGIDASPRLIKVALARTPDGDIREGDMFDLPWEDASFDVVTSFRGIWGGCEERARRSRTGVPAGRPCRAQLLGQSQAHGGLSPLQAVRSGRGPRLRAREGDVEHRVGGRRGADDRATPASCPARGG